MSILLPDFPKLESPFIRKRYKVSLSDWKKYGNSLQLREPEINVVTPDVNPNCDWVFNSDGVYAVEKLDGTNTVIEIQNERLSRVQNRLNVIDYLRVCSRSDGLPQSSRFLEGILEASSKNYLKKDGIYYGELIGPKIQGNGYNIDKCLFYPFIVASTSLRYKSFEKHPKEFWGWCDWFRLNLRSLFYAKVHKLKFSEPDNIKFAEGVVIYQDELSDTNPKSKMCKLRRDMYPWYYWEYVHIEGLEDYWIDYAKRNQLKLKGY